MHNPAFPKNWEGKIRHVLYLSSIIFVQLELFLYFFLLNNGDAYCTYNNAQVLSYFKGIW